MSDWALDGIWIQPDGNHGAPPCCLQHLDRDHAALIDGTDAASSLQVTVLKDDLEPRKTKRETLTRNYCHSCQAPVCNDLSGDDGKLDKRVRLVSLRVLWSNAGIEVNVARRSIPAHSGGESVLNQQGMRSMAQVLCTSRAWCLSKAGMSELNDALSPEPRLRSQLTALAIEIFSVLQTAQ